MMLSHNTHAELEAKMQSLKGCGLPFAMATVVRTVNATSAKPGGKALLDAEGAILMGWVGGGCARGAIGKAAREAIRTGEPRFISLRPQELLDTEGLAAGETRDGVHFARNGCPSKGTMDVFVEPVLPLPELVICGSGLVALALADLGDRFDFKVRLCVTSTADVSPTGNVTLTQGFGFATRGFVVVATQGQGDRDALRQAVSTDASYISFVGSTKKFDTLARQLTEEDPKLGNRLRMIHAPAGLDINAITPEEIALSILAQITQVRRSQRIGERK
ncbi:XdhC family protein [Roseobacter weihaiensis]|uniref:XdhC family protein n=1 Tax=Roseobacter weihaiensis TaxID=2763262 RepID=UPI001D09EE3B|nr:XdhC family protein [Roseobacter sp. H9]